VKRPHSFENLGEKRFLSVYDRTRHKSRKNRRRIVCHFSTQFDRYHKKGRRTSIIIQGFIVDRVAASEGPQRKDLTRRKGMESVGNMLKQVEA
jgi:hypothetical protein